jgi:hypothetical protein
MGRRGDALARIERLSIWIKGRFASCVLPSMNCFDRDFPTICVMKSLLFILQPTESLSIKSNHPSFELESTFGFGVKSLKEPELIRSDEMMPEIPFHGTHEMCQLNVEPSPIPNSILRSEQAPSWN